jgi:hypothetical protein
MRWRATRCPTTLCLAIGALACEADDVLCPADVVAGLEVEVRDAVSGVAAAINAVGEARSSGGTYALEPGYGRVADSLLLVGAWNRWGLFQVVVMKEGYRQWTAANVLVESTGGPCARPRTVRLEARLEPES